jgi:hypothetical protein
VSFSVVIPLHNKCEYIARAIDSALAQSLSPVEVLVIDDGSTDASAEVVRHCPDPRVRLIQQANAGPGAARNTGLQHARGDWVAFLDADDWWWPDHLAELALLRQEQAQARLLACACLQVANGQMPQRDAALLPERRRIDYFAVASRDAGRVNSTCAAVRRFEALQIGGFSTSMRLGEDLDFWCRMACRWPVAVSDKPTSVYFRQTQGAMETVATAQAVWVPLSLQEVSAPIPALLAHLEHGTDAVQRQSIVGYINSRVMITLQAALWRGQAAQARHLASLMLEPLSREQQKWKRLSQLPDLAWLVLARVRTCLRQAKHLQRRISGMGR